MIARIWHGWTRSDDALAYEELLRSEVLPGFTELEGYRGAHVLRRVEEEAGADASGEVEVEFITITWFDSMEAVRAFSSDDDRGAVVPDRARRLLERFDADSTHYEVVVTPEE